MNSTKEFCEALRKEAQKLASGEKEFTFIPDHIISAVEEATERHVKISHAYIRTIMNRTPEVRTTGSISVKRIVGHEELPDGYKITINKDSKRRVLTSADIESIKAKTRADILKKLMEYNPDVSDMEMEEVAGAIKAIKRYKEIIRSVIGEE